MIDEDEDERTGWVLQIPTTLENQDKLAKLLIVDLNIPCSTDYHEDTGFLEVKIGSDFIIPEFLVEYAYTTDDKKISEILNEMNTKTDIFDEIKELIQSDVNDEEIIISFSNKEIHNIIGCINIFLGEQSDVEFGCKEEQALLKKLKAMLKGRE